MSLQGTIGRILRSSQSIASITRAAAALQAAEHCPRWYSTPSSNAEASSSGVGAAVAPAQEPAGPRVRRKWTRKERGSWVENGYLMRELDEAAVDVPEDMPLYDTQTDFPWHFQPHAPYADMLARVAEAAPQMLQLLNAPDHPLPYPGAQHILRWETTMVLVAGPDHLRHPKNRKVKCYVRLRALQDETGLTDEALQHIALICGPRYNPRKGELTLTCEKHPHREENRRDILDTLHALIAEGERAFPQADPEVLRLRQLRDSARDDLKDRTGLPVPPHISVEDLLEGRMAAVGSAEQRQALAETIQQLGQEGVLNIGEGSSDFGESSSGDAGQRMSWGGGVGSSAGGEDDAGGSESAVQQMGGAEAVDAAASDLEHAAAEELERAAAEEAAGSHVADEQQVEEALGLESADAEQAAGDSGGSAEALAGDVQHGGAQEAGGRAGDGDAGSAAGKLGGATQSDTKHAS